MVPVVTLAFPLYKSRRFFNNIIEQADKLIRPDYEIIFSDRHGLDDTLSRLRQRYGHDARFRFIEQFDEANWVVHHNDLMHEARGLYFAWISHDDYYQPDYFDKLQVHLDARPQALAACGKMQADRHPLYQADIHDYASDRPVLFSKTFPYTNADLINFLFHAGTVAMWHGLFRREVIVRYGLDVRWHQESTAFVEFYWLLALAIFGPLSYEPKAVFTKHFHPFALHYRWQRPEHKLSENLVAYTLLCSYIRNSELSLDQQQELLTGIDNILAELLYKRHLKKE